jgi:ABC-type Na+ transport system ATPase subunit NatA
VQRLAARFVALSKGTVVAEGSVDELATRRVQELIAL